MDAKDIQRDYYNLEKNQYKKNRIFNPPVHTSLEINALINRLKGFNNKNDVIVDFGAGAGRLTIPLLQQNYSVLAVDISAGSLKKLKETAKDYSSHSLRTSTVLPLNQKYKAIVGTDILHHIDMDEYLPLFYKILEKGGKVVFSEPGALNVSWYIYLPLFHRWEVEKGVVNCTRFNLVKKFKRYGFQNINLTGLGLLPRPFFNFSKILCRWNDWLGNTPFLHLFAYRYIIEAHK